MAGRVPGSVPGPVPSLGIFVHFCYQPDATTRKVKYDHPVDGQAHFSQDGRIVTSIRNQAERLDGSTGHIFSLDIAGIRLFRKCTKRTTARTASAQITFSLEPFDPLHVAGFWFVRFPVRDPGVLSGGGFGSRASGEEDGAEQVRHAASGRLVAEAWLQDRERFADELRDAFRSLASGREVKPARHARPG